VHERPAGQVLRLRREEGGRLDRRQGVGHVEDRGDVAAHRRPATRQEIFPVVQLRIPEVDVRVHQTGQEVMTAGVDGVVRAGQGRVASDGDDPTRGDGHAAVDHTLRGEDASVGDAQIRVHGSVVPQNGAILREAAR
jgi:hypothetical protein